MPHQDMKNPWELSGLYLLMSFVISHPSSTLRASSEFIAQHTTMVTKAAHPSSSKKLASPSSHVAQAHPQSILQHILIMLGSY